MGSIKFGRIGVLLVLCGMASVHADDEPSDVQELQMRMTNEWQLINNDKRHKIKTYARKEDGKRFRSFKVEAVLDCKAETLARVLLDFDNYPKWYWQVAESRLLKKVSATEYYLYFWHRAPFNLPDRDVVLRAVVDPQTATKSYLTLRVEAVPDFLALQPPLVRMQSEDMAIRFTPLGGNKVTLIAEGYIDPGGQVPSWAINLIQRSAPYAVALGLQRMVDRVEYTEAKTTLPFPVLSDVQ